MTRLGKALALCASGHQDQTDKGGVTYALHPIRLVFRQIAKGRGESHQIVAALHDYFEDCKEHANGSDLSFLTPAEKYALECLTHKNGEDYLTQYMPRVLTSPLAMDIKEDDLIDNSDGNRMPNRELTEKDLKRWEKYRRALEMIRVARLQSN